MIKKFLCICIICYSTLTIPAREITIVFWNAENVFDTIDDPDTQDTVLSQDAYLQKLSSIKDIITPLNADYVCLAEIENTTVSNDIAKYTGFTYSYLIDGNDPRGIDLCFLSNEKISYNSNKELPTPYSENRFYKFSRDCPVVHISSETGSFYILLVHLKSLIGDMERNIKKQVAQTKGILDIIYNIYENDPDNKPFIIITGDFNSYRNKEPLNILQKSGLIILNYYYKEKTIYTTEFGGKKKDLDYFIVNKALFDKMQSFQLKRLKSPHIASVSDHYPLILTFTITD